MEVQKSEWIIVVADLIQELGDIEYEEGIEARIYEEQKYKRKGG